MGNVIKAISETNTSNRTRKEFPPHKDDENKKAKNSQSGNFEKYVNAYLNPVQIPNTNVTQVDSKPRKIYDEELTEKHDDITLPYIARKVYGNDDLTVSFPGVDYE